MVICYYFKNITNKFWLRIWNFGQTFTEVNNFSKKGKKASLPTTPDKYHNLTHLDLCHSRCDSYIRHNAQPRDVIAKVL